MPTTRCAIGKRRFMTRSDAEIVLACLDRTNPARREQRVYCCPTCDGWHLTSWSLEDYNRSSAKVGEPEVARNEPVREETTDHRPLILEPTQARPSTIPTPLEVAIRTEPITKAEAARRLTQAAPPPCVKARTTGLGAALRARVLAVARWAVRRAHGIR